MAKRFSFDDSGDSQELQSLFDSIAAQATAPAPARPHLEAVGGTAAIGGDSDELEALFDSVSNHYQAPAVPAAGAPAGHSCDNVFNRLGHMTRQLHDTLRQLGYDRSLQEAAKAIPDARQRLAYIAQMTEQAASRVLNATDVAKPIQDDLQAKSTALNDRWDRLFVGDLSVEEFKALAGDTKSFLAEVPKQTAATSDQLMEIMMAQDFQDLTGQVIKKIVDLAQSLEQQLLQVLIEAMPEDKKAETPEGLLNGPVVSAEGRADVVTSQEQVDDLLESLGF
ncbi:MAG: protein phosphatase CheZ [Rhodocyclales bacterium]|nr:protein phosphatase CheZ [Rhodocyclales bacterium]